ncbi:hypothetical protein [Sphingomonas japonica]|uniref:Uncharacterized protein n=1 Tax=Sphingomonas japonica TaxID=511662 RepID=A0ABX0U315_9SPHN|nr:hypothetical protein [Sphingomonas japonica]NIJ23752.1 hypothetical protein [Sphingomonas japonica]
MIDNFSILLTHGLMLIAAWRLLARGDLDDDAASPSAEKRSWRKAKAEPRSDA